MNQILAAFINAGIAGALVTMAVAQATAIVSRRALNASTRYAIWFATLVLVVILPVFWWPHSPEPVEAPRAVVMEPIAQTAPAAETSPEPSITAAPPAASAHWLQFPLQFAVGPWPGRILFAWTLIALLMLARLAVSYWVMERRKRRAYESNQLRDWPVRALTSHDISSPMAAGLFRPAILIPERLLTELSDEELDQIRLHETAHILRRDDIALLVERTIEAVFALHPVVRWIARRIDLEREIACDDFVVEQTGKARPYAACLTHVVEVAGGVRSSIVAAAATEEHSHLAKRIEMLLDKTREKGTRVLKTPLAVMLIGLFALTCAAVKTPALIAFAEETQDPPIPPAPPEPPAPPIAPMPPAPPAIQSSTFESHRNNTVQWRTNDGLHSREMRINGEVHFNDTDSDVQTMSPGSYFSYEESFGISGRRYEAMADSSGQIKRRYLADGREKPFDTDAQAWLRAALPDIIRNSGIDAPERVRRILKQGGVPAVLAEIGKINSDGTKARYIKELTPIGNLNVDQFQTVLRLVRGINSDGEKASLLIFLTPYTLKDGLRDYFFEAIKTINSDGEKHRVLTQAIIHDSSHVTLALAARAAAWINSDGEKAAVLVDLAPYLHADRDLSHLFFHSVGTINSDGERARVLMSAIASAGDQRDTLSDALRTTRPMNSDGEKAGVLVHAAAYWKEDDEIRAAYFEAAKSIHSDGEKSRVLTSLTGRGTLGTQTLMDAIHCATGINSDGEKARALIAIANHPGAKGDVRDEIKSAARTIHSDGEFRRVMQAVDLRADGVANRPQAR